MLPLPREHGAYGQMAPPLVTAVIVAGLTPAATLAVVGVVAGLLAHEPAAVLRGLRGSRARRERWTMSVAWLAITGAAAVGAWLGAWWLTDVEVRWTFGLPLMPALVAAGALAEGTDKSVAGETGVALAFSSAAVPVTAAAGTDPAIGFAVAAPFAVVFLAATFAVRTVTLGARGASPRAVLGSRAVAAGLAAAGGAGLAWMAAAQMWPWASCVACLPGCALVLALSARPPGAAHLRRVGWAVASATVLAAVTLAGWL